MKELCYALFHCDPFKEPPFTLELGFSDRSLLSITGCEHIPDAIEKLESYCTTEGASRAAHFTLLYPIYLEAMDTDAEATMHEVAHLIKGQADRKKWNFERIGGYSGKTRDSFVSQGPSV
jgi:hypothetical protein